jgi:HAE1 family hydrophobic/amphiphilic exporter-1
MKNFSFAVLLSLIILTGSAVIAAAQVATAVQKPRGIVEIDFKKNQPEKSDSNDVNASAPSSTNLARVGVQTAQPITLSLEEAVRRALESNNDIEVSRYDVRFQDTQIDALRGIYDPVFTTSPVYSRTSRTGSTATNDFRANTGVNGFVRPGGGDYQVFFNNARTESAFAQAQASSGSISASSGALYTSGLGVQYNQPLFRNFSIDNNRRNISVQKKRVEQTDADFRIQILNTINQVQRAYWDLVLALRDQQNRVSNLDLARENLRQIEARIEAGAAAPVERAEVATELAIRETDLLSATQLVSTTENTLKQLLFREPLSAEWSQSIVPTDAPTVDTNPVNLDQAIQDAINNRFELKRLKLEREINDINIRYYKNQTKPQIDLNTSFSLSGLSRGGANDPIVVTPFSSLNELSLLTGLNEVRDQLGFRRIPNEPFTIPAQSPFLFGGFNRSLTNLFRSDAPNFSIGVTISFPFRNRTAKANLAGERILGQQIEARTRSQEQSVIVEVRNAVQAVETARLAVMSTRRERENAEIQLQGERKLYEGGRSTTFLLFQRENALTTARDKEIRALTGYKKAVADYQRVTATTFRANNIDIQSPLSGS